jgi:hypothetical protein
MNKKTLLLIALTFSVLATSFAGDITDKKNLFTILGGMSVNTMNYEENTGDKKGAKIGGLAGFSFEHRFKNVVAFELQALYTNKGTQSKTDNAFFKTTNKLNFHSVEVPLLVKFYLGKKKIFNLNVGGYASYAFVTQIHIKGKNNVTNANVNDKSENLSKNENNPKDANGQRPLRPFDAGVIGGFEFVSRKGFGAGARLEQGFVDFTNPKYTFDDDKKIWHTGVQLYALFKF